MNIINIQKAALQRVVTQCLSINCIWPFISFLINHTGKHYLLKAAYSRLVASASKRFFQVPPRVATQLLTSREDALPVYVSSGNADEAHSNLCKTPLQLFTVDWIIDRLLLSDCQDFPDFPKDMSDLSGQPLKHFTDF